MLRLRICLVFGLILASGTPVPLQGQIPIPTLPTPTGGEADTVVAEPFRIQPPVSPLGALWRSMLLPGWGQSILRRRATGAAFVVWEGISFVMTVKSAHQLSYLRRVASEEDPESMDRVLAKEREVEDWAVLLAFNHLLAGAEAFVATYFWDFPEELDLQASPEGGVTLQLSFRLP